jgi:hypothetical protein
VIACAQSRLPKTLVVFSWIGVLDSSKDESEGSSRDAIIVEDLICQYQNRRRGLLNLLSGLDATCQIE